MSEISTSGNERWTNIFSCLVSPYLVTYGDDPVDVVEKCGFSAAELGEVLNFQFCPARGERGRDGLEVGSLDNSGE